MAAAVFPGEPEEFRASGHQQEPACWGKPKGKPLYSWETKPHPFISPSLHSSILVHGGLCILDFLTRKVGQASVEVLTHMEKNKENGFWLYSHVSPMTQLKELSGNLVKILHERKSKCCKTQQWQNFYYNRNIYQPFGGNWKQFSWCSVRSRFIVINTEGNKMCKRTMFFQEGLRMSENLFVQIDIVVQLFSMVLQNL